MADDKDGKSRGWKEDIILKMNPEPDAQMETELDPMGEEMEKGE